MAQETNVQNLIINKLTKAQYDTITPSTTELYFVTDDSGITSADIIDALGYIPLHRFGWLYVSKEGRESVNKYMDLQMQQALAYPLKTRDFLRKMNM